MTSARPTPWVVERSRHVLRDRWISVRADDCRTDDGVAIAPFYVLEYADWVQIVALDDDDHVLLVEQYRHGLGERSLELPTGAIEARPPSKPACASSSKRRASPPPMGAMSMRSVRTRQPMPIWPTSSSPGGIVKTDVPQYDPSERVGVVRLPVDVAIARALDGTIKQSGHVAAILMALHRIGRWPQAAP